MYSTRQGKLDWGVGGVVWQPLPRPASVSQRQAPVGSSIIPQPQVHSGPPLTDIRVHTALLISTVWAPGTQSCLLGLTPPEYLSPNRKKGGKPGVSNSTAQGSHLLVRLALE